MCCGSIRTASSSSWSTSIRTPTSRSICGCGCWRRRRRAARCPSLPRRPHLEDGSRGATTLDEASPVTTTCASTPLPRSGSGAGTTQKHLLRRRRRPVDLWLARRRGRQHPALRPRFSRRQGHPPRAQLPLDRPYPRRRLAPDRAQRRPARQDAAHRGRRRREGHRHRRLGFRGRSARHRRGDRAAAARKDKRSTRSPSWCAPRSRCASSKTASSRSACPIA